MSDAVERLAMLMANVMSLSLMRQTSPRPQGEPLENSGPPADVRADLQAMFPPERIEAIKRRELRRFKQAQDEKWQNWLESVSK